MTLPLTPEMLAAAYEYMRTTPPFCRLKLPPAAVVKFTVGKFRQDFAEYRWDGKHHTITMSVNAIGHTTTLMRCMAHEAIHLYLEENGLESRAGGKDTHNAAFRKLAAQVCRHHGFDAKAFY
jgi:hypothetical protein